MTKKTLITLAAMLTAIPASAQTAQEIANSLTVTAPAPGATQLEIPSVPGAQIEILGADYEQLISKDGKISPVLSDTPVLVSFKVTKDGKTAISKDKTVVLHGQKSLQPKPQIIPEIQQWCGKTGSYAVPADLSFYCDDAATAKLIGGDLSTVLGREVKQSDKATAPVSFCVTGGDAKDESYTMNISPEGVVITAATAKGVYWGSRTLLQMLRQDPTKLPCGEAVDMPRYGLRGFMLDIARTPYTLEDLRNVINIMAWYKMNDLHLVINNNFIFHEDYVNDGMDPLKESYTAFRLESDLKGADGTPLTATDVSYTKKEFVELIEYANARGVNIVPEIDTPGHALSFTRLRPDLIYQGRMNNPKRRCEMLDAANPETLRYVGQVFDEYMLPNTELGKAVFDGCVVHVGSDEFYGQAEDYRRFTDGILRHVISRGYQPRVWGSLSKKPGKTPVVAKGVQMNLWNESWMDAMEAINAGYDVINTNDGWLYIVPFANYYRMDKRHKAVYERWQPNLIGRTTIPAGHPQLIGSTFAVWNDMIDLRHSGYGMYDIWNIISDSMNVLSQKMWGSSKNPLSYQDHHALATRIGSAPGINPLYIWADSTPVKVTPESLPVQLDKPALGPFYSLSMELELESATPGEEQVLLSSPEGQLIAVMKDGSIGFRRNDAMEFSFKTSLPVGQKVKLDLIGKPQSTELLINGQKVGTLTLNNFRDREDGYKPRTKGLRSTFILPLQTLGESFKGKVYSMEVKPLN